MTSYYDRYECRCEDGYSGQHCELELDECDSDPCLNGAFCVDFPSRFRCECNDGFVGDLCETG